MIMLHDDLDGCVSAFVLLHHLGDMDEMVIPVPYLKDKEEFLKPILEDSGHLIKRGQMTKPSDFVIFVDLGLENRDLSFVRAKATKWIWIDHHKTSESFNTEGIFDTVILNTEGGVCASDLA